MYYKYLVNIPQQNLYQPEYSLFQYFLYTINIEKTLNKLKYASIYYLLKSKTAETKSFEYKIIKKRKQFTTTRNERKNKNYLQKQLNSLNIYNDEDKIKYLYFEYFGKFTTNPKEALARLKQEINNEPFNDNLKYFFKLSSNHN